MDKLKRYIFTQNPWIETDKVQSGQLYCKFDDVAALEAKNAELVRKCDNLEEQTAAYGDLVDRLSHFVSDFTQADGWYLNDPAEMIQDIRDEVGSILVDKREANDRADRLAVIADTLASELDNR